MEEHLMSRLSRLEVQIENIEKSLGVVQAETKANNQLCNELNKMVIELKISSPWEVQERPPIRSI